jgi:hypothetical protein
MMKAISGLVVGFALLSACTPPQTTPLVTEYNGNSVKIFAAGGSKFSPELVLDKANEACASNGATAKYQSTTEQWKTDSVNTDKTHMFICS